MQLKNEQFRLLQRLGGASVLFIALVSVLNLIGEQLRVGVVSSPVDPAQTEAYLAYLRANPIQWPLSLLWSFSALLALVGVQAAANRLEPFQPVWAGLARTWGIAALLLSAVVDLLRGLPFYLVQVAPAPIMDSWLSARMAFFQIHTVSTYTQELLLILFGLSVGMAARKGGLSKVTCLLSFAFGGLYLVRFLLWPGLMVQSPVNAWLGAVAPFLQLLWLIWAGVELIRFPDSAAGATKAA